MAALFVATTNKKKLGELVQLLSDTSIRIVSPADFPGLPEVDESGTTFAENAQLKAVSASLHTRLLSLADDSGLEVDALGGAPGVHSARFAATGKDNASDEANRTKLLKELSNIAAPQRTARFRCAIAVAFHGKVVLQSSGSVEGIIIDRERGTGGFGYDSLFVPNGFVETFAELSAMQKSKISHRARALAGLRPQLLQYINILGASKKY